MLEPKHFSNHTNDEIEFYESDFRSNAITLRPAQKRVQAEFLEGSDLLLGIPNDFENYYIVYHMLAVVTEADLDYMVTWTNANSLVIDDKCNVALGLLRRIDQMAAMKKLTYLQLNIHTLSTDRMHLRPFFRHLPSLRNFLIIFDEKFTGKARNDFLAAQEIPDTFKMVQLNDRKTVRFDKKC